MRTINALLDEDTATGGNVSGSWEEYAGYHGFH